MNIRHLARATIVASAATTCLYGAAAGPAIATAAPPTEHKCLSNLFPNSDLNERYGVTERIVGPPGCREALAGEQWVRAVPPWAAATEPDIQDFNNKFLGARWVTDGGTDHASTVTAGKEALRTGFHAPNGLPFSAPVSPAIHPLSVGNHTNIVYVTLSAPHCNGLGICLPAGESQYDSSLSPDHPAPEVTITFVAPSS